MIKKSKLHFSTTLILIILAIVAFASFSGAWFTASASQTVSNTSATFVLGNFGDVTISANDYTWRDIENHNVYATAQLKTAAHDDSGIVRSKVMPGDKVQSGSVSITFDSSNISTYPKAYYLIKT